MTMNMDDFIDVTLEVPSWIAEGLNTGSLFREGGVVRRNTGKIAMFLRESSGLSRELAVGNLSPSPLLSSQLSSLQSLSIASIGMQALNLGISAVGFVVVAKKLNRIESKLNQIHQKMDELSVQAEWISRKQDLAMIAKMEGALETADRAIHASSNDIRRNSLIAAMHELTEVSKFMRRCLNDLISSREYLSNPQLFDLYYRTWACCRVAIMQCELLLDENGLALRDVENTIQENEIICTDYLCNIPMLRLFAIIDAILLRNKKDSALLYAQSDVQKNKRNWVDHFYALMKSQSFAESPLAKPFMKTGELILNTGQQLKGYQLEIDYVRQNEIAYREWMDLGESEEPRLSFLLPKKR